MAKYPPELREAVLRQVLSGDMTAAEASRHFDVSYWSVRSWLQKARRDAGAQASATEKAKSMAKQKTDAAPLPNGKSYREMAVAMGYCRVVGFESSDAGAFCRNRGLHLKDVEAFTRWFDAQEGFVPLKAQTQMRQLLDAKDKNLRELQKELKRKEKALAEAAALLVLSKKVQAIREEEG